MIKINKVRHKNPDLPPYIGYNPKVTKCYYYKRQNQKGYFHISFLTLEEAIKFKDNHEKLHGKKPMNQQQNIVKEYKLKNNINNYIPEKEETIQKHKEIVLKNGDTWYYYWLEPKTSNTQQ
jgi:hypothetical protein